MSCTHPNEFTQPTTTAGADRIEKKKVEDEKWK